MTTKLIKNGWGFSIGLFILIFILIIAKGAYAKIPEPDNIIYGTVKINGIIQDTGIVTMKINGGNTPIVSYHLGENPQAGNYYVLRVPMDALTPRKPQTCVPGDSAKIFINDILAATVVIGEKGSIHLVHIDSGDTDDDDLPDDWEMDKFKDLSHDGLGDTDKDGLNELSEYQNNTDPNKYDTDADGFSDGIEVAMGLNPIELTTSDVTVLLQQTILILKLTTGNELSEDLIVPDIDGDGRIGTTEAVYILRGLAGAH